MACPRSIRRLILSILAGVLSSPLLTVPYIASTFASKNKWIGVCRAKEWRVVSPANGKGGGVSYDRTFAHEVP
jgi:hypothetical protein